MSRVRLQCIMMLAGVLLLLPAGVAAAQGRGAAPKKLEIDADPVAAHAAELAKLESWLGRLTGRFRVSRGGRSMGLEDCAAIGEGSGVHCIVSPPPLTVLVNRDLQAPTMVMYGLDPDAPGIRYLQVDGRGLAEGDRGELSGDTVTFSKVSCLRSVNQQPRISIMTCDRRLRIYAPPDSRHVLFQYRTEQLVVVPTPPGGRRPPGQIATQLVQFTESIELQRVPEER